MQLSGRKLLISALLAGKVSEPFSV